MSEREAGIARSAQHTIHVLPHTPSAIARFLEPALDRVAADADATQLIVLTADADTALVIAEAARSLKGGATLIVPITAAARGTRLLGSRVVPAIAATPGTIVSLLKSSSLKLGSVRTVLIAWANELIDARESETLEIVLAEVPKEASRVVVADQMTPAVETLVERHLRRASRQTPAVDEAPTASLALRYLTTSATTRRNTFRRLLDDLDPPSVIVIASDEATADEARTVVASLGYEGEALVRVVTEPVEEQATLVVFYDLPSTPAVVEKVGATEPAQVIALVAPRQVAALKRLTSGAVEPMDVSHAAAKARARDEKLRSALRTELHAGFPAREVMALEPLLAEFDGLEIAAAAVRLIERERSELRVRRVEAERPVERVAERPADRVERSAPAAGGERPPTRNEGGFARVYLSIGDRDGVRAGDLVGAIAGESGITSDRIGKLEIRDSHTVAEIAASDAATVVEKMNGVTIKGRSITARIDDRPAPRGREGGRPPAREGRGDRRPGGFREGGRSGPREGARGGFGSRDRERPPREREARDGGREGPFSREGRPARGPGKPFGSSEGRPSRGPGKGFGGGDRRPPRRDDDRPRRDAGERPRSGGGFRDRPDDGRIPRATHERQEWTDRADAVRNARRPRRDQA